MAGTNISKTDYTYNPEELRKYAEDECRRYNETVGDMEGYDCPECKNRGLIAFVKNNNMYVRRCSCMNIRISQSRLEQSGLAKSASEYTFEKFNAQEPWQKTILEKATGFANEPDGWFYIGGQVGSGKTHICTAITGHLIKTGHEAVYMLWTDDIVGLKAAKNDDYTNMIKKYKESDVLYIDDFMKTERGRQPTSADINIAFELLNYRYINRLITILSGEKTIGEILDIDEATGSRIKQRSGKNCISISADRNKNYRLK